MATAIPPQPWLRDFVIGLGLSDAHRIVQSYITGGLLRPVVEPQRVEQMTAVLLEQHPELLIGLMPDLQQIQTSHFFTEYADLIQHYPFQIPLDLLFMYRALGFVGSVVKQFNPNFELSTAAAPLAAQLLKEEWEANWRNWCQSVTTLDQLLLTPPVQFEQVLSQAQTIFKLPNSLHQYLTSPWPTLNMQTEVKSKDRQTLKQLDRTVNRLAWMIGAASLFIAGIGMRIVDRLGTGSGYQNQLGISMMMLAFIVCWFGFIRRK